MSSDLNPDSPLGTISAKSTSGIAIQATQWSELPDVDRAQEFSEKDAQCIRELHVVLTKYDQLERFGIALLHKHFEVADDEFLLETTDVEQRTQFIRPVKKADYSGGKDASMMATVLKLMKTGDGVSILHCHVACRRPEHHKKV